jgi:hypothetical protein
MGPTDKEPKDPSKLPAFSRHYIEKTNFPANKRDAQRNTSHGAKIYATEK